MKTSSLWLLILSLSFAPLSRAAEVQDVVQAIGTELRLEGFAGDSDYEWSKDGDRLFEDWRTRGVNTAALRVFPTIGSDSGLYVLTSRTNWIETNITTIIVEGAPPVTIITTNYLSQQRTNALYTVDIVEPPTIRNFFMSTKGDDVAFEVAAEGGRLSYQWYWQGEPIPGATTNILQFENAYATADAGYYSVVVSNIAGTAHSPPPGLLFIKPAVDGTYQGLFYDQSSPEEEASGFCEMTVRGRKRTFSGKASVAGVAYRFSGVFSSSNHVSEVVATSPGREPLVISNLQLTSKASVAEVRGTVGNGTWSVPLLCRHVPWEEDVPHAPVGTYTLAMVNTNLTALGDSPDGSSYASILISESGRARMFGRLADGSAFTHSCGVSKKGDMAIYTRNKKTGVFLIGWVQAQEDGTITGGPIRWVSGFLDNPSYPGGFNVELDPFGSPFVPGTDLASILPFTKGVAVFAAGDMISFEDGVPQADWVFTRVWLSGSNHLAVERSPEDLKLNISPTRGVLSGSFVHHKTKLRTPIRGVLIQNSSAYGYFLSQGVSGYFALMPEGWEQ